MTPYVDMEDHEFHHVLAGCSTPDEVQAIRDALAQEEEDLVRNFRTTLDPSHKDVLAQLDSNTAAITRLQKYASDAFVHWTKLV